MGEWLLALTFFGYLAAAVLAVAELYASKLAKSVVFGAWVGFSAETLWLGQYLWIHLPGGSVSFLLCLAASVWVAVGFYLTVGRRRGWSMAGAFLFPIGFPVWFFAQVGISHRWGGPFLGAPTWVVINGLAIAASVAFFLLLAVFAIMYTEKERELKQKHVRLFYYQLPALNAMDGWMARMLGIGWPWFTAALLLVAIARQASALARWPDAWHLLGALLVWVIYGVLFCGRFIWHWPGHRAAVGSMLAFLGVLANFFAFDLMGVAHPGFW